MAKYTGPRCKLSRRTGTDLLLTSHGRSIESKCKFETPPGTQGSGRRQRLSDYATQLREKQKLRRMYGLMEKQFHKYYVKSSQRKGATGVLLLQALESRLDNVVYRMGFAATRAEARQLVNHKAVAVNDRLVNVPSYEVQPGDVVAIRNRAKNQNRIVEAMSVAAQLGFGDWLSVDDKKLQGTYTQVPDRDQILQDINENLVVELYSK
ncbi:30S ribosomal protein S4 [Salinisphaera sp. USBA-960]|uniref:30S ribosomal protein S4 n=1 Tax=Salinisphaera orenii TaxID=856731 RepID=UPI000DBE2030|nr:30S ribosomal protein S4 [Salifodinibacter halophilus]NNC26668.1 30S ribosomal protein S4 [Salifodinibacter halophilus]